MPEYFAIIQFTVPMYTALICGFLFFRMYLRDESPLARPNIKWAICAYFLSAFCWFTLTLYIVFPIVYNLLTPLILFSFMMVHIMYYRFVFEITRVNSDEKFPVVHYLLPVFGFIVTLILSFFIPFQVRAGMTEASGTYLEEFKLTYLLFTSNPIWYFMYEIVYALFGLRRTIFFRKIVINYSADEQRISLTWLYQFFIILLAALPMLIAVILLPHGYIIKSGIALLSIIIAMLKDIILAHNVLLENYVIIKPDKPELQTDLRDELFSKYTVQENIKRLEEYMQQNKPYLNPRLKITDMIIPLNTNRTTLSLLINRTYGMNFCRYINRYRLEEFENIRANPLYANLDEMDMVSKAGFSDYRGYRRVKRREDAESEKLEVKLKKT